MVVCFYTYNPSTQGAEGKELYIQGQLEVNIKILSQKSRRNWLVGEGEKKRGG